MTDKGDRTYRIEFASGAERTLRKLDKQVARRVGAAINKLARVPRPPGAKAMRGEHGYLRIRVGDHRVIYTVKDGVLLILVVHIGHRREIYDEWSR